MDPRLRCGRRTERVVRVQRNCGGLGSVGRYVSFAWYVSFALGPRRGGLDRATPLHLGGVHVHRVYPHVRGQSRSL